MAASLLDIAKPGQPWLPGQPVDANALENIRTHLNSINWWQRPPVDYNAAGYSPLRPFSLTPPAGFDSSGRQLPATATSNTQNVGPFTAETLTKNPELAAILKKLYGDISGVSTDPNQNQTVLQKNTKDTGVEAAGQAALQQQQADATNNSQSIADFAKSFMAAQPAATAQANLEAGNINRVQNGALAADLAANQKASDINSTQNLMRRLGQLAGSQNLGDLTRGGVTNSNANANILRAASEASLARDAATNAAHRQNIMDVQNLQIGTAGLPQRLIDAVLQRQLVPVQAGQASSAADLNRLQGISSLLMGNNLFTPQTHAGLVGQVQQLLQGQAGIDPAAYYRYVSGNFPDALPGVVPQQSLRLPSPNYGGGGGNMSFDDIMAALQQHGGVPGAQPSLPNATPVPRYQGSPALPIDNSQYAAMLAPYLNSPLNQPPAGIQPNRDFSLN